MQRILVLGCCGAGKSVFSQKLHEITKLPLITLDKYYWKANWRESDGEEWQKTVQNLTAKTAWIMDGNYSGTLDLRLPFSDTIYFLDYSTTTCLTRVVKRTLKYWRKVRPHMAAGCKERFNLPFLHYLLSFHARHRPRTLRRIQPHQDAKDIFILRNDREATNHLNHLKESTKFTLV